MSKRDPFAPQIEAVTLANGTVVNAETVKASEIEIGDRIINTKGAVVRVDAKLVVTLTDLQWIVR